jgi:hypothetical protein
MIRIIPDALYRQPGVNFLFGGNDWDSIAHHH